VVVAVLLAAGLSAVMTTGPVASAASEVPGSAATIQAAQVPAGFVYREGRRLMLDGSHYRFVGFNAFGIAGCATGTPWRQNELDGYFAALPPRAMTRTWAFEQWRIAPLELAVARAEAHGQKLIFSLAEAGGGCEPFAKDAAWYASGYRDGYLSWVRTVVSRFKDSPAIGMWEIINEPGHTSTVDDQTMKAFFDDVAAVIKGIDPKHLIGTGSMAEYTNGTREFAWVHSGPNIDVGSLHEYDHDPADQVVSRHLAPTLTPMYQLDKPLIVGETGILAGPAGCQATVAQRAEALRREFDADFLSGVAGVLVWTYSPNPKPAGSSGCEHQVRAPENDPTIAMLRNYRLPTPVSGPSGGLIENRNSGKCLDVSGAATADGALVQQYTCWSQSTNQRFTVQGTSDGFFRLVALHSGKCLDVGGQPYALSAPVRQWKCAADPARESANRQFRFEAVGNDYYRLVTRHSIQCLSIAGQSVADAARLVQYDCKAGASSQHFRFR